MEFLIHIPYLLRFGFFFLRLGVFLMGFRHFRIFVFNFNMVLIKVKMLMAHRMFIKTAATLPQ